MSSSTFKQDGRSLHVTASGKGPPTVLIHGLSGSRGWWRYNLPALRAQSRVYSLELSGYGHARRQRSLSVRDMAALVAAWMDAEDLRNVTLVGHSMGGHISMHVAALAPDRVRNLVLVCASGLLRSQAYRAALHLPRAALIGRKRFLTRVLTDAVRAGPLNLWRNAVDLLNDSVQDSLPLIRARTLIIWGERDVLVPLAVGELLHGAIAGSRLEVVERAGHIVMVDAPQRFNGLLLDFMAQGPVAPDGQGTESRG